MHLLLGALILAQVHVGVNVLVTHEGTPLPNAWVLVRGAGDLAFEARTDDAGVARFLIPAGEYEFEARGRSSSWTGRGMKTAVIAAALVQVIHVEITEIRGLTAMPVPAPRPKPNYAVVEVHFATDRALSGSTEPAERFSGKPDLDERLRLGVSQVSIPRDHRAGELESPSIFRLEFSEDPEKHVVILETTLQRADDFYKAFGQKDVIVFIHGYANTFSDAIRRAAQMKYDLAFYGQMVAYTWPSSGDVDGYMADENNVPWTAPHLKSFLESLAKATGTRHINIIAHSMGNRVLGDAIQRLAAAPANAGRFQQIILAAPDIDARVFKRDIAPALKTVAKHVTLYASSNDQALAASKRVHEQQRAGETLPAIVTIPGIDTIDVTGVDTSLLGHSYVADNGTVLSDLFCAIRGLPQAAKRCGLKKIGSYWQFARTAAEAVGLANYQCSLAGCTTR